MEALVVYWSAGGYHFYDFHSIRCKSLEQHIFKQDHVSSYEHAEERFRLRRRTAYASYSPPSDIKSWCCCLRLQQPIIMPQGRAVRAHITQSVLIALTLRRQSRIRPVAGLHPDSIPQMPHSKTLHKCNPTNPGPAQHKGCHTSIE